MEGRPIVREATLKEFRKDADFVDHMGLGAHARNEGPIYQHPYKERPRLASDMHHGACPLISAPALAAMPV